MRAVVLFLLGFALGDLDSNRSAYVAYIALLLASALLIAWELMPEPYRSQCEWWPR